VKGRKGVLTVEQVAIFTLSQTKWHLIYETRARIGRVSMGVESKSDCYAASCEM
jgi:hypothetical protein